MRLVLLDTQQWNYLVAGCGHIDLGQLQSATEAREVQIVGSVDVLQELIGAAPKLPDKYRKMSDLYFALTGKHQLKTLRARHAGEVKAEGLLPESQRYLNRATRRSLEELARHGDLNEIADDAWAEATTFKAEEEHVREAVREKLESAGHKPTTETLATLMEEVEIDEWVREITLEGVANGLHSSGSHDCFGFDRLPSTWTFVAYQLARIVATLGEGRKIQASDLVDARVAACGPYIEMLVTDDKELRRTLEAIPHDLGFRWCTSKAFAQDFC